MKVVRRELHDFVEILNGEGGKGKMQRRGGGGGGDGASISKL